MARNPPWSAGSSHCLPVPPDGADAVAGLPETVVQVFEDGSVQDTWDQKTDAPAADAATPLWSRTDAELIADLDAAYQQQKNAAAQVARLVGEIIDRDIPAQQHQRIVARWLGAQLLLDPRPARELADQAAALRAHPGLEQAVLDEHLDLRQAVAIADTLHAIPASLDDIDLQPADPDLPTIAAAAEAWLIERAAQFPAAALRHLGERILAHVAPQVADRADEAALQRQERRARETRGFTLSRPVGGVVRLSGSLDVESAAIVDAALQPLCRPTPGDQRTPRQQRADALVEVCSLAMRARDLPTHGGEPAQIAVTVVFDPLTQALGAGGLDNGQRLSAHTVRRVACDAKILPIILGGEGQVLDAGRSRRLATGSLRRALVVRDRGCAFPDCDRPPRWCDGHHLRAWADGGPTTLDNMVLVCRYHHGLLHEPDGWQARLGPDRLPEFIPPPWIDPARRPRRNLYHPRIQQPPPP